MNFLSKPPAVYRCVYCRSEFPNGASALDHRAECSERKSGRAPAAKPADLAAE